MGGGLNDSTPRIEGATDGTEIGNTADSLKTNVTNAAGASAVNIQDGGNSITVDGTVTSQPYQPATFCINAMNIAIGNNKSMIAIQNTTGSSVVIKIKSIKIINSQTSAVTGVISDFRLRIITSFSAGTSITPLTFDTNDSLSVNVSAATGSTVSGESSSDLMHVKWSSDDWGVGTLDTESNDHANQALRPFYEARPNEKPITLRANEGLTIKHVVNSTAGTFAFIIIFTQE